MDWTLWRWQNQRSSSGTACNQRPQESCGIWGQRLQALQQHPRPPPPPPVVMVTVTLALPAVGAIPKTLILMTTGEPIMCASRNLAMSKTRSSRNCSSGQDPVAVAPVAWSFGNCCGTQDHKFQEPWKHPWTKYKSPHPEAITSATLALPIEGFVPGLWYLSSDSHTCNVRLLELQWHPWHINTDSHKASVTSEAQATKTSTWAMLLTKAVEGRKH